MHHHHRERDRDRERDDDDDDDDAWYVVHAWCREGERGRELELKNFILQGL